MGSLLVIGHLTRDRIRWSRSSFHLEAPGGPSFYIPIVASIIGLRTKIVSKVGEDYPLNYLKMLEDRLIDTSLVRRTRLPTTTFELTYDDAGDRSLRVLNICEGIGLGDCQHLDGDRAVHIGPVIDEVAHEAYGFLSRRSSFLSTDIQGIVRSIDNNGHIHLKTPGDFSFLDGVKLVKATGEELQCLFGVDSFIEALRSFLKRIGEEGVLAVTFGRLGCLLLTPKEMYRAPAYPTDKIRDPTGAGDVLVGGILSMILEGEDLDYALAVGVASASFCIEKTSVHGLSIGSDLGERIQWVYSRIRREPIQFLY
ncbi:MAG: PfkB family carbohydrate kinase [Candidatus Bathyarchaeia archaeon]